MLTIAIFAAQVAATVEVPPLTLAIPAPQYPELAQEEILPASAKAVVDHVDALYKGDIDGALTFVDEGVKNTVSDLNTNMHFPSGRTITKAMYLSITREGKLPLSWFSCRPEAELVRCDMRFGTGKKMRDFTLRYRANDGPITQIYSWENRDRK